VAGSLLLTDDDFTYLHITLLHKQARDLQHPHLCNLLCASFEFGGDMLSTGAV
jgi:hypothetical protein